jgi:hypothetical protein
MALSDEVRLAAPPPAATPTACATQESPVAACPRARRRAGGRAEPRLVHRVVLVARHISQRILASCEDASA